MRNSLSTGIGPANSLYPPAKVVIETERESFRASFSDVPSSRQADRQAAIITQHKNKRLTTGRRGSFDWLLGDSHSYLGKSELIRNQSACVQTGSYWGNHVGGRVKMEVIKRNLQRTFFFNCKRVFNNLVFPAWKFYSSFITSLPWLMSLEFVSLVSNFTFWSLQMGALPSAVDHCIKSLPIVPIHVILSFNYNTHFVLHCIFAVGSLNIRSRCHITAHNGILYIYYFVALFIEPIVSPSFFTRGNHVLVTATASNTV